MLFIIWIFFPSVNVYTMRKINQQWKQLTKSAGSLYPLNIYQFLCGRDIFILIQSQAILKIGVKIVTSLNTDRTVRST